MPADLDTPRQPCPSCAPEGGYGHSEEAREYRCPDCTAVWAPDPDGPAASTRIGNLWQRVKVLCTSRR